MSTSQTDVPVERDKISLCCCRAIANDYKCKNFEILKQTERNNKARRQLEAANQNPSTDPGKEQTELTQLFESELCAGICVRKKSYQEYPSWQAGAAGCQTRQLLPISLRVILRLWRFPQIYTCESSLAPTGADPSSVDRRANWATELASSNREAKQAHGHVGPPIEARNDSNRTSAAPLVSTPRTNTCK